ncbi:hypothetical protein [Streptomyces albidoflavus]|uniref:hypothetical protein n=1 Tax=Streptomyces albidoflavus TaxID=1886 RepID=UPI0033D97253
MVLLEHGERWIVCIAASGGGDVWASAFPTREQAEQRFAGELWQWAHTFWDKHHDDHGIGWKNLVHVIPYAWRDDDEPDSYLCAGRVGGRIVWSCHDTLESADEAAFDILEAAAEQTEDVEEAGHLRITAAQGRISGTARAGDVDALLDEHDVEAEWTDELGRRHVAFSTDHGFSVYAVSEGDGQLLSAIASDEPGVVFHERPEDARREVAGAVAAFHNMVDTSPLLGPWDWREQYGTGFLVVRQLSAAERSHAEDLGDGEPSHACAWSLGDDIGWTLHATTGEAFERAISLAEGYADRLEQSLAAGQESTVEERITPDNLRRRAAQARLHLSERRLGEVIRAERAADRLGRRRQDHGGMEMTHLARALAVSRETANEIGRGTAWT